MYKNFQNSIAAILDLEPEQQKLTIFCLRFFFLNLTCTIMNKTRAFTLQYSERQSLTLFSCDVVMLTRWSHRRSLDGHNGNLRLFLIHSTAGH